MIQIKLNIKLISILRVNISNECRRNKIVLNNYFINEYFLE